MSDVFENDIDKLTSEDLAALEPEMLRFARNEIFARHGRLPATRWAR